MATAQVVIAGRYNGPPGSGHGGYTCGRLAMLAQPPPGMVAAVTLLAPPPLDTPMEFRPGVPRSSLWWADTLVATVSTTSAAIPTVAPVAVAIAEACAALFPGRTGHPYPTCFGCGPDRSDGLRLSPGPVSGTPDTVACVWRPSSGEVTPEYVWSVMDCPSGWVTDLRTQPKMLSRMMADLRKVPLAGQPYVVVATKLRDQGRTTTNGSSLYDARGALVASATMVWTSMGDRLGADSDGKVRDAR